MKIILVTKKEMINTIKFFKTKTSSGNDGISNTILKWYATVINKPFTFICNSSFASGIYRERFKFAIVRPIHKKGDRTEMANCRPISLSKILETLMFNKLDIYLQGNKSFSFTAVWF
jgi:hypothetical protein